MTVNITIRNVPMAVRDELAARAARRGKSMQQYLRAQLAEMVSKPSVEEWLDRARRRAIKAGSRVTSEEIVASIREDRGR